MKTVYALIRVDVLNNRYYTPPEYCVGYYRTIAAARTAAYADNVAALRVGIYGRQHLVVSVDVTADRIVIGDHIEPVDTDLRPSVLAQLCYTAGTIAGEVERDVLDADRDLRVLCAGPVAETV